MCKYKYRQTVLWIHREGAAISNLEGQEKLSGQIFTYVVEHKLWRYQSEKQYGAHGDLMSTVVDIV